MRNTNVASDVRDEPSLYQQIVDATGIEYNRKDFPGGAEDYKNKLVRFFGDMSGDDFDKLSIEVRDWINDATETFNQNRREKERELLPDIEGLVEPAESRRARVAISDDDDDEPPAPPAGRRGRRAVEPEPEDEPEDEPEPEPEPARAGRGRGRRAASTPAPAPARGRSAPAPVVRQRDPDSGRYAKVMPHYLKHRNITIEQLQDRIEKTDGASYSETTLDRTLAACRSVVAWLENQGVSLDRLSR